MKKITLAILAIAFIAAFNSCKEEEEIQTPDDDNWEYFMKQYDENTPRTKGTFVMFGANTYYNTGLETRTAYSGDGEYSGSVLTKERIDWVSGDLIQIFCNQAQVAKNAEYRIDDNITENNVQSVATVSLNSAQGLKWNDVANYTFQGIYPPEGTINDTYPEVTNKSNGGYSGSSLEFTTIVPANQQYNAVTKAPDMRLAGMVATTKATTTDENGDVEKGNVSLVFYPIVTTLQFDLKNVSNNHIRIESIFLDIDEELNEGRKTVAGTYKVTVPDEATVLPGVTTPDKYKCNPSYSNFTYSTDKLSVSGIKQRLNKDSEETVRVVMFALPVVFTGAKLGITMRVDNGETDPEQWDLVTRRIALNDKSVEGKPYIVFQPTHKYNFKINIPNSTVFEVTPDHYGYDISGGPAPISVTSYTYNAVGDKIPVAWTATEYSIDGGEHWNAFGPTVLQRDQYGILPTMLEDWDIFSFTDVEGHSTQFVTPVNGTVSYNKPPYRKLKEAAPAKDVDLSTRDVNGNSTLMNTANCYMVHARGTYKFPIVYGNAIKNGATNTIAFNPTMDRSVKEIQDSITYSPYKKTDADGRWITLENEPYYSLTDDESREKYFGTTLSNEEKQQLFNVGWGNQGWTSEHKPVLWTLENNPAKNHFLSPFLNHAGQGIREPWLKDNVGVVPKSATLLWEDSKGLIKDVEIIGQEYVSFTVVSDKEQDQPLTLDEWNRLVEGNALIAVKDASGTILWSWHIWVTEIKEDQNINSTDSPSGDVYAGQTMASSFIGKKIVENSIPNVTDAKIAAYLGLCDLSVGPRKIQIKFVQEGTEATEVVTLTQERLFDVNAPFYQYGRKDPLKFQKGINGSDRWTFKDLFDDAGDQVSTSTFTTTPNNRDVVYIGITKPTDFCTNNGLDDKYYNLWAARLTRIGRWDAVRADKTKTIYDPCPAGYRVPSLADVAGWAGNNNSDGYHQNSGALPGNYRRGRVTTGWSETRPYAILDIDGESKNVYVPFLQGSAGGSLDSNPSSWRLQETASWVSTPVSISIVQSAFNDTDWETPIKYGKFDPGDHIRRTEIFYWYYYRRTAYSYGVRTRWDVADQSCYQIRFGDNAWMNESGANKNNAVNVFMVKETGNDTCSDVYQQETQN